MGDRYQFGGLFGESLCGCMICFLGGLVGLKNSRFVVYSTIEDFSY